MVGVAQLVRAPDCGSGGRGFETRHSPHTPDRPIPHNHDIDPLTLGRVHAFCEAPDCLYEDEFRRRRGRIVVCLYRRPELIQGATEVEGGRAFGQGRIDGMTHSGVQVFPGHPA